MGPLHKVSTLDLFPLGFPSVFEWAMESERSSEANEGANVAADDEGEGGESEVPSPTRSKAIFRPRESAGFSEVKSRDLSVKLEVLLDLIFRRLFHSSEVAFSHDGLLRMLKKIDKDMGP